MERMIFVNLPVQDLKASRDFYLGLGFTENTEYSDDNCSCIVVSDTIFIMLLVEDFFQGFLADGGRPHLGSAAKEMLNGLSAVSVQEVDDFVAKAEHSGGTVYNPAKQNGPMYGASIADPDGHVWDVLFMDIPG